MCGRNETLPDGSRSSSSERRGTSSSERGEARLLMSSFGERGRASGVRPTRPSVASAASGKDRKSTRLNSSHVKISYAVFCLKKKNTRGGGASTGAGAAIG